jgi:hypothetical protein
MATCTSLGSSWHARTLGVEIHNIFSPTTVALLLYVILLYVCVAKLITLGHLDQLLTDTVVPDLQTYIIVGGVKSFAYKSVSPAL